jgi:hypothetical protein
MKESMAGEGGVQAEACLLGKINGEVVLGEKK